MPNKKYRHATKHHLIPQSRAFELKIEDIHDHRNLYYIHPMVHKYWHKLWENMTPYEVAFCIESAIKMGFTTHPYCKYWYRVFKDFRLEKCLHIVKTKWTPSKDYYDPDYKPRSNIVIPASILRNPSKESEFATI